MRFRSLKEDLQETTLGGLPGGVLARMAYLAELRSPTAGYEHWGMARVHGEAAVQAALHEAHVETMDTVLRRPLAELYGEGEQQAGMFQRPPAELLPPATDALRAAHFNLVWDALMRVSRRRGPRHPIA